ncbi:MAG: hypothetical protein ACXVCH_09760, partial [Bdellovibrionota bacterium]
YALRHRLSNPYFQFNFNIGFAQSLTYRNTLPMFIYGADFEVKPWYFGFRVGYERGERAFTDGDVYYNRFVAGLPIYIGNFRSTNLHQLYLMPEWMSEWGESDAGKFQCHSYGGALGYRWQSAPGPESKAVVQMGVILGAYHFYDIASPDNVTMYMRLQIGFGF